MTRIEIIDLLLRNPELQEKYNYSEKDIDDINDTSQKSENEFISFVMTFVKVVEDNPMGSEKIKVKKIFNNLNIIT